MFSKVLIANRGEIALRILRACHTLGLETVAVYSANDKDLRHVKLATSSICIGPAASSASYLNHEALLIAAKLTGADAVHPGYGFLSENSAFAEKVQDAGLTFIGPTAHSIREMGDKVAAKKAMLRAGVPCVPGSDGELPADPALITTIAEKIGYPVIVKASGGGGGRGMRIVRSAEQLASSVALTREEAQRAFGNAALYIEKYLQNPRHIEIQVLADQHGNAVWLGERDCSMQRRHQKVIEESPAPGVAREAIRRIGRICADACIKLGYRGAGTFEFLYEKGDFYFIEMNTRVQVEHPVTEMVTGVDIVAEQLRIAQGEPLSFSQESVVFTGHAIECRINAEHPEMFTPSPGLVRSWIAPGGPGIRVESHLYSGYTVPHNYDSMVAKIIAWGKTREEAINRMRVALEECEIDGIVTTIPLQLDLLQQTAFRQGGFTIQYLEKLLNKRALAEEEQHAG
ncbi:acetyl-CoA carboxylase biotin carboxylase subunit [Candidatus Pantoea bituminis]|uniref:acetyl-CoA carboxylase biotin carboxylase subunit n=1 Tax=Candidatus Pantoea bituminis TaxID=2831036 RepID=UPI001C063BA3|nr:acetyl-CoA carboxylase biotin carboxylase subunit [Pantoea bituminis]